MTIICGDCLDVMKTFPDNHFSAVVTDSPYGISFMSKGWDRGIPSIEYWKEMLRITKPSGHLLAAGLPRMMHRLISVIEDSGWQIRDLLMHLFGSGFPKSHNRFGIEGYGTCLKPAWEGWSLSMKPCEGTFKQNAEKWGQAGINIDATRVSNTQKWESSGQLMGGKSVNDYGNGLNNSGRSESHQNGRWPANLILDEESSRLLDQQSGISKSSVSNCFQPLLTSKGHKGGGYGNSSRLNPSGHEPSSFMRGGHSDSGGASRFFYCPKASSAERNEGLEGFNDKNNHPTVKPLKLMEYLIKLVMPPSNGLLLDPFAGSGTTILAAKRLGFDAIGIEKSQEYCEIALARLDFKKDDPQMDLFSEAK